ncbi:MAG: type II secretion system protein [Verrucomicrobiia bacterium]
MKTTSQLGGAYGVQTKRKDLLRFSSQRKSDTLVCPKTMREANGLTLVEVLVSLALLGMVIASSLTALSLLNSNAMVNRNQVAAMALMQDRIEQFLSIPYTGNPAPGSPLAIGVTTETGIPIVINQTNNQPLVTGTLQIRVTDGARDAAGNVIPGRNNLQLRRATFTLTYRSGNRNYTLTQTALRANDL